MRNMIVVLASFSALSACDGTLDEPSYTWFEGLSLTFEEGGMWASHSPPTFNNDEITASHFAVAFPDASGGWLIAAFLTTPADEGDLFVIQLPDQETGTYGPCGATGECHGGFSQALDVTDFTGTGTHWQLASGTATVESVGNGRIEGPLSNLHLQAAGGSASRIVDVGYFNVSVLSDAREIDAVRCFLRRVMGQTCE